MRVRKTGVAIRTFLAASALLAAGCTLQLAPDGAGHGTPSVAASSITVKIINRTGKPLDPRVYVGRIANGLNGLFVAGNKRTDFGVGGVGILTPDTAVASFSVACDEGVFIATQGGIFGDDLTAPLDQGQQFVLEEGLNVRCGDMVVFAFYSSGDALITSFSVEHLAGSSE